MLTHTLIPTFRGRQSLEFQGSLVYIIPTDYVVYPIGFDNYTMAFPP